MIRRLTLIATLGLVWAPLAHAANGVPPDVEAQFQQTAQKSCSDDLDAGHFERWNSMEDCVAEKTTKMERAYRAKQAGQAAPSAQPH